MIWKLLSLRRVKCIASLLSFKSSFNDKFIFFVSVMLMICMDLKYLSTKSLIKSFCRSYCISKGLYVKKKL